MTTNRQPRPPFPPPAGGAAGELKRIPLPSLPHFRSAGAEPQAVPIGSTAPPATNPPASADSPAPTVSRAPTAPPAAAAPAGAVSHLEMSELLAPGHEGGLTPVIEAVAPRRTGSTGATILNNLVDEIEKGLERDLARSPSEIARQQYRRVVSCSLAPGSAPERRARE